MTQPIAETVSHYNSQPAKPLTTIQNQFVEAYFECGGKMPCVAKKMGKDTSQIYNLAKVNKIKLAIAQRSAEYARNMSATPDFRISKSERLELLWRIAEGGAERITDKEGNMIMAAPAVSVSAIRTINDMLPGSLAPKEVEVTHKVDTRSETEIRANIARLNSEYASLIAIDGEVTEEKVKKVTDLPAVSVSGKVSKSKKVHVD